MKASEAMKGSGIDSYKFVSKGTRKAEVIVTMSGGNCETRHLQYKNGAWQDRQGNRYGIS